MVISQTEPQLVESEAAFDDFLDAVQDCSRLAVDTEANSMHAYRARLCLIQVSSLDQHWVLDPLSGLDLDPFFAILEDEKVEIVFHDAEFDVLQLRRADDVRLRGLFDTKVVALALGEAQIGLAALVEKEFSVKLDKTQQRSDWGKRPLAAKQIRYAADDTRYLLKLADLLRERLEEAPEIVRLEVAAEVARLERLRPKDDKVDPDAWARLKGAHRLEPVELRALRDLWTWREARSAQRDVPPFKVLGNAQLLGLARSRPVDARGLERVEGFSKRLVDRHGRVLLEILDEARDKPGIQRPEPPSRTAQERREDSEDQELLDRLKRWRKRVAVERSTDPSLVLQREVLEDLAKLRPRPATVEELEDLGLLEDWRIEAHGAAIVAAICASGSAGQAAGQGAGRKSKARRKNRKRS